MRHRMRAVLACVILAAPGAFARADEPRLAEFFGFLPLEIYKLDNRISNLALGDLDGDGIQDVIVANNARSRIDLLLSSKGPTEDSGGNEANLIPSDRRMRLKSVPVNKEIVAVQSGDFNGDGKADIAYYGNPAEVLILPNEGNGAFGTPRRINSGEAVESANALAVGDLDGDGKADLALLTPSTVVLMTQKDGKLSDRERLPHTAANPRMLKIVDLDGDGHNDLVLFDGVTEDPIRIRFGTAEGKLGPEERFALDVPRALAYGDMDGKPGVELLTIELATGRAKVLTLAESDEDDSDRKGRLIFYPLPKGDARGRSIAVGDLDGDGKADVVATDPANAQFLVYLQGKNGLGTGDTFPGLSGGKAVFAADFDGDKKAEVVVLSENEKQIGLSRLEDGKLTFPAPLPLSGDPVALTVADLDGDGSPEVLYATTVKDSGDTFTLRALRREPSGNFVPMRWGQDDSIAVKGLSGKPPALRVLDVNGDKLADILVFNAYGSPVLLLGRPGGEPPAPAGGSLGPLVGVTPQQLSVAKLDGPAILVAHGTFARKVALDKDGQWRIEEQFNAGRPSTQILGANTLDLDGDGKPEVALLDKNSKDLLFLAKKPDSGVYTPAGQLSVGPLDFEGTHVADFDGDGRDDLLLAGTDKFGVVLTGRKGRKFRTLASYDPTREDAHLGDLIVADINGDKKPDVILTDVNDHLIDILDYPSESTLNRGLTFKIFEKKSFRDRDSMVEPRDMIVGDVDGDGRTDLVLLVHDRVLIYRQDSGEAKEEKTAEKE